MLKIHPVVLTGRFARLEPLQLEHVDELAPLAVDEQVWRFLPTPLRTAEDVRRWVEDALDNQARGDEVPFVAIDQASGRPIGSTRLMDIRPAHRAVEIGATWLGTRWWRTSMNTETKYLLLHHAFEELSCLRVSLKTDLLNVRSQRAIERLGAVREGVLRKHMIVQGERVRDTVYYSILDDEWPPIRLRMEHELYGHSRP